MRCRFPCLAAMATLFALAFAILPINAEDESERDPLRVIAYPVSDMPVWKYDEPVRTKPGKDAVVEQVEKRPAGEPTFDASLLILALEASMNGKTQEQTSITLHERSAVLIVRATRANQQKIADALARLRNPDGNGETDAISQSTDHQPRTELRLSPETLVRHDVRHVPVFRDGLDSLRTKMSYDVVEWPLDGHHRTLRGIRSPLFDRSAVRRSESAPSSPVSLEPF